MHINYKNIKRYLTDEKYRFIKNGGRGLYKSMPDERYLQLMYMAKTGFPLNLRNPQTFNEKIQWLKLYDRKAVYHSMADKYEAKKYIADMVGEQYVIPTLQVYNSVQDINFDELPQQFVLKCTHDSHGVVICRDKSQLNVKKAKMTLKKGLKRDYYLPLREWVYKDLPRRIIAEEYVSNDGESLIDYKVHNFNGEPRVILVCKGRYDEDGLKEDFYDCDWNHLNVKRPHIPNAEKSMPKPEQLEEMLDLSRKLSKDIPFLRTDFYIVKGKLLIGELTFYPASGFGAFVPESFDRTLGDYLILPKNRV